LAPFSHERRSLFTLLYRDDYIKTVKRSWPVRTGNLQKMQIAFLFDFPFLEYINAGADNSEPVRRQGSTMQLVGQVLLMLFIFLVLYLLHRALRSSRVTVICLFTKDTLKQIIENTDDIPDKQSRNNTFFSHSQQFSCE
jgi:hypothetical protein